jgi:hypothetical protein
MVMRMSSSVQMYTRRDDCEEDSCEEAEDQEDGEGGLGEGHVEISGEPWYFDFGVYDRVDGDEGIADGFGDSDV